MTFYGLSTVKTQEEQVRLKIASSFAENMLHYFPDVESFDEEPQLKVWLEEAHAYVREKAPSTVDGMSLVKNALQEAKEQYKSKQSSLPSSTCRQPQSFSLLDAFSGGGLASVVTWQMIVEQGETDVDRMKMLHKVSFLDDVLPDWPQVQAFLQQAIRNPEVSSDCVELHRKWFGLSRSSMDYQVIQLDLCENVVTVLSERLNTENDPTTIEPCVRLFHDMWLDWMIRDVYVEYDRVSEMGKTAWNWMNHASFLSNIVSIDPHALWFQSWAAHLSASQMVELTRTNSILPSLVQNGKVLEDKSTNNENMSLGWYSLSVIHSVLAVTRVARFPWNLLKMPKMESIRSLFDLYVHAITGDKSLLNPERISTGLDAIEIILWGIKSDTDSVQFDNLLRNIEELPLSDDVNCVESRLKDIANRLKD